MTPLPPTYTPTLSIHLVARFMFVFAGGKNEAREQQQKKPGKTCLFNNIAVILHSHVARCNELEVSFFYSMVISVKRQGN